MKKRHNDKPSSSSHLSGTKKRLFFLVTLLSPVLLFALLEGALRFFNYGPDLSLFKTELIAGRSLLIMNPEVKSRYFSGVEFNPSTSLDYFPDPKPDGTYRIFCLGGSTTAGFPYGYAGSFAAYLRDRLERMFPEKRIEVINLGMTATNSFTTNDIARELPAYEPDLIIVYDGHNEFYGALGTASHEAHGSARWLTLAYLKLVHLRAFALLRNSYTAIRGLLSQSHLEEPRGTMMERLARGKYIALGSSEYAACLQNFRKNLSDLVHLCSESGVPVILTSQVSNLRNCPPFVPGEASALSDTLVGEFNDLFTRGLRQLENNRADSALASFVNAARLDSVRGGIQYRLGQALDRLGRYGEAAHRYVLARDHDMLRFRTSTEFNNAIKEASEVPGALYVDMESAFRKFSSDSLIGSSLILEHLHPNERGYFIMAREYASAMQSVGMIADEERWPRPDSLFEDSLWNDHGLTEVDARAAERRIELLTSGWPFRASDTLLSTVNSTDPLALIVDRYVNGELNWEQAHVAAAQHYESMGDLKNARAEYRALIRTVPINVSAYLLLARTYLRNEQFDPAADILRASLGVEPTGYAYRVLGSIEIEKGRPNEALPFLTKATVYSSAPAERSQIALLLGIAHQRLGNRDQAIYHFTEALRSDPQNLRAQTLLRQLEAQ